MNVKTPFEKTILKRLFCNVFVRRVCIYRYIKTTCFTNDNQMENTDRIDLYFFDFKICTFLEDEIMLESSRHYSVYRIQPILGSKTSEESSKT